MRCVKRGGVRGERKRVGRVWVVVLAACVNTAATGGSSCPPATRHPRPRTSSVLTCHVLRGARAPPACPGAQITTSVNLTLDSAKQFATGSGNTPSFIMLMVVAAVVTTAVIVRSPSGCYLVDFALFEAPPSWRCDQARFNHQNSLTGTFTQQSMDFQNRILTTSTLEDTTSFPPGAPWRLVAPCGVGCVQPGWRA